MTSVHIMQRIYSPSERRRWRTGLSSLEVLVSFTLLTSVLALATPLVVRHGRLLESQRDYRLALDELSNQLERLTALPQDELSTAVEQLSPSSFAASKLPGATLTGELAPADIGQRLTLQLWWDESQRRSAPVSLSTWVFSAAPASDEPTPQEDES